ncbi:MAG TPA: hypothetical protein VFG23_15510 [Polyangia bacterium]|nr:hypothetical protein [Polyangia bacterium]
MATPTSSGTDRKAPPLRALSAKEQQKLDEFRLVAELAIQRRCTAIPVPEEQQWPDAHLKEQDGTLLPVEVVAAYWRAPNEDPHKGSPWKRAHAKARREAQELTEATGIAHSFGAHYDEPFVVPADGKSLIPPSGMRPVRPDVWIIKAVEQKAAKRYSEPSILLVDLNHFDTPRFEDWNLGDGIAKVAGGRFLEVWIVDQYSRIPRRFFPRGPR